MPDYPNIDRCYANLAELIELDGSGNELNIRPAFRNCLAALGESIAEATSRDYQAAAGGFLQLCHPAISPNVSEARS